MDKEFIPHQESLELVGLGYDEPVEFFKDSSEEIFDMRTPNDAPCILWQQAFRWFREKYNQHHFIHYHSEPSYTFAVLNDIEMYWTLHENISFKTYEQAELACLRKLIEIVKEK